MLIGGHPPCCVAHQIHAIGGSTGISFGGGDVLSGWQLDVTSCKTHTPKWLNKTTHNVPSSQSHVSISKNPPRRPSR